MIDEGKAFSAGNAAVRTSKLLQLANGSVYTGDPDDPKQKGRWSEVHDEKIKALESVVEEAAGAQHVVAYHLARSR